MALVVGAVIGWTLHAVHHAIGLDGSVAATLIEDVLFLGLFAVAATFCAIRARTPSPERRLWLVATIGIVLWALTELLFRVTVPDPTALYPAGIRIALCGCYVVGVITFALIARGRLRRLHVGAALDGVIGGLALTAIAAIVMLSINGAMSAPVGLVSALGADLVLLTFVVVTLSQMAWRPDLSWGLMAAAIAVNAVGTLVLFQTSVAGDFARGGLTDTLFVGSALLMGLAALPSARAWPEIQARTSRALALPFAFALVSIAILVVDHWERLPGVAIMLAAAGLVLVATRAAMAFAENERLLTTSRREALTDALTGLGNRRHLMVDLQAAIAKSTVGDPRTLVLFDLDGFKHYNDAFGHPAGDQLIARLGRRLAEAATPERAYRVGGDEFCLICRGWGQDAAPAIAAAATALTEEGRGFEVGNSHGRVELPREAGDAASALRIADGRMYDDKDRRRASAHRQVRDALVQMLAEREPALSPHLHGVADLVGAVGRRLGLDNEALDEAVRGAELHDIGKVAIPDAILRKAGPLSGSERAFVEEHTIVGERILLAAPALAPVAALVRASHERWDGTGYPDGLAAEEIPLGARIIAVCDAYDAIRSDRPYRSARGHRAAIAALLDGSGSQFDPRVVAAFCVEVPSDPEAQAEPGTTDEADTARPQRTPLPDDSA